MQFSAQQQYRRKTLWLTTMFALLVLIQVLLFSLVHMRYDVKREITTQASMVVNAVRQGDRSAQPLERAATNPRMAMACIFNRRDQLVHAVKGPRYGDDSMRSGADDSVRRACTQWKAKPHHSPALVAREASITDPDLPRAMGSVLLVAAPGLLFAHYGWSLLIFLLSILAFGALCLWIGYDLHRTMLRPIRQIATTAQRVSLYKDYSLRVRPAALRAYPKEIELLIESFNAMLVEIEDRDTRLMRKTVELEKSRTAAEAANIAKSQFLANISHELRTPLNAIIGFSEMLAAGYFGAVNDKQRERVQDINLCGTHLLQLISDILEFSKGEAGKLELNEEEIDVRRTVEECVRIVAERAKAKQITLHTELLSALPELYADKRKVRQILLNLLSNAIKFTPAGGTITVGARLDAHGQLQLAVADTGVGIAEEDIPTALAVFGQVHRSQSHEGTGLGLPLCKMFAELHGGRLQLNSTVGSGTTVRILFPENRVRA